MPSTIPYDPALTLLAVVNDDALQNAEQIAGAQAPVDAAQEALNSLVSSKRSLNMTRMELQNLGVPTDNLDLEIEKMDRSIEAAATKYSQERIAAEPKIQELKRNMRRIQGHIESPVDFLRTELKTMPLAADSVNMDVRYVSLDFNSQTTASYSSQIASHLALSVGSVLGSDRGKEIATTASRQVIRQIATETIEGTLILSVACTHKNASVAAPLQLNVDKAVKVWNTIFPGDKLDPTDRRSMIKACTSESQDDKKKFSIISGTSFGSSFIGMVYILKPSSGSVPEDTMNAVASSLQATMDSGAWFAKANGKIGLDSQFTAHIKSLLSQQGIRSRATILTTGVIPSTTGEEVNDVAGELKNFDPQSAMEQITAAANKAEPADLSVKAIADASRLGIQTDHSNHSTIDMVDPASNRLKMVQSGSNKVLDLDSMMSALDSYLVKVASGSSGVPINYYLKDIDMKSLAQMWVAKYFPGEFVAIKYDDTENHGPSFPEEKAAL